MTDEHRRAPANRLERRTQRTRAAPTEAAQGVHRRPDLNTSVLDLTQAADVDMGSFYDHCDSKEELFEAVLSEFFDLFGGVLDHSPPGLVPTRPNCYSTSASVGSCRIADWRHARCETSHPARGPAG
jgi:hypothetical protein